MGRADEEQGEEMWNSLIGKMEWRFLSLVQGVLLREYIKKRLSFGQCPNFLRNFCPLDMRREKKFLKHVQRYRGGGQGGSAKIQSRAAFYLLLLP